jgi:hypothetical protein
MRYAVVIEKAGTDAGATIHPREGVCPPIPNVHLEHDTATPTSLLHGDAPLIG